MAGKIDRSAPLRPCDTVRRVISGRLVCAVAMVGSVAVTGCGSGTSSSSTSRVEFKTGLASSQREFRRLGTDIARDITGAGSKTDAQLAKEFGGLATRAGQQAAQLAALTAPARYTRRMSSLVAGFHAIKADLSKISTAATDHDASSARTATRSLLIDAAKIKTADTSLSKDLGLPPVQGASSTSSSSSVSSTSTTGGG